MSEARDLLFEELERYHYPIREIETLSDGDEVVELAAILVPTSANPQDLNAISGHLAGHAENESATWTVSTES